MYKFENSTHSVRDFISLYGNSFPVTAVVSQGFLGQSERESFALGQVLRLHAIKTATRVSGKIIADKEGRYRHNYSISLPITPDLVVRKVNGNNKAVSLENIVRGKHNILPCKVTLVDKCVVLNNEGQLWIDQSVTLLLEQKSHHFRYIVGCPVLGVDLLKHTIVLPEFLDKIRLSLALGVEGFTQSQWVQLQAYMSDVVHRFFVFDDFTYLQGIHLYPEYEYNFCLPCKQKENPSQTTPQYEPLHQKEAHDNVYETLPDQTDEMLSLQNRKWKTCLQETSKSRTVNRNPGQCKNKTIHFQERQSPPALPARPAIRNKTTIYEPIEDYSPIQSRKMSYQEKVEPFSARHASQTLKVISQNETRNQENVENRETRTRHLVLPQRPQQSMNPSFPAYIPKHNLDNTENAHNNSLVVNQTATKDLPERKEISPSGINIHETKGQPYFEDIRHMTISDVGELLPALIYRSTLNNFRKLK